MACPVISLTAAPGELRQQGTVSRACGQSKLDQMTFQDIIGSFRAGQPSKILDESQLSKMRNESPCQGDPQGRERLRVGKSLGNPTGFFPFGSWHGTHDLMLTRQTLSCQAKAIACPNRILLALLNQIFVMKAQLPSIAEKTWLAPVEGGRCGTRNESLLLTKCAWTGKFLFQILS